MEEVINGILIREVETKNIMTKSSLPVGGYSVNPYVGCTHACKYCYASFMKRFTGHTEEWGTFLDVKHWPEIKNPKKYAGQRVVIGSVTDGYNPQEEQFGNTRKLLEQLIGSDADILICTKSDLVVRDIDLLKKLGRVTVSWSINTLDENFKNDMDSASSIERRIAAMKQVYEAGIRTVCFVSPVFPGITDFEAIFERVKDQCDLFWLENLNLRGGFKKTIMDYIAEKYPDLVPLYDEIYNKHNRSYFEALEVKAAEMAKKYDCPFVDNEMPYGRVPQGHPVIVDYFYHEEIRGTENMSRLGRNYLQVGFYTEVLFPQKNVRFLAINNSIDSNNASDNDFAPFLNIMNEWYAKDTSNKIKAVFDARMKDGKRCSGSIPYGYNRLPNDKQTLVVDPVASEVVKRIFLLANEGKSPRTIAELLTEEKVLIPAAYAKKYHPEQYNGTKFSNPYLWGTSSVRTILGRQEYLGHTVLRKSVSTNFKLHKRKETDEDEQYVFQNTHEPIISQELWDSVQKRRCRVNRASAWGTHTNRLSGYLYCADCGRRLTLQTHYSKKDGSTQYSYRCGGYASRVNGCTAHSISADNVEALILASVKRFSRFVLKDEETFALELQSLWKEKREEKPKQNQSELKRCQKRYDELSALIRSLYENLMSGLLPERQYKQLMAQYDSEQAELESQMETMKSEIAEDKSSSVDIQHFISLIRKCKNPTEISDSMFNELVDKIVVYEAEGAGNARTQKVDIYFNYVGQVDIAYTEEELAELKAQKEQEEGQRMEKQRKCEKAYREKRKAKIIAKNGGEIIKTKTCPHCGKVFTPTSNRQLFCSRECWNQARLEQKKADREAERGTHYYRQRACAVCGHSYWPTHSQQEFCSEECRRINHNRKTLEFYHKKKENPKPDPEATPTPKPKEDNAA